MPYIHLKQRKKLDEQIKALALAIDAENHADHDPSFGQPGPDDTEIDPGILNYAITKLLVELKFKKNYRNYNAIVGALSCCKDEYYRRVLGPYEDSKCAINGDVYDGFKGVG